MLVSPRLAKQAEKHPRRTESLDLPAAVPTDDDTWRVVETWIEQRRVPGSMAAALLRAACTTVMRAYARGRLREAVRVSQHPGVRAMTEDQISAYVEASIREVLHQDAMRERYELIENAAYTSMARTTDDEYVNTWLDAEKSMLESPRFQILRDELVSAVDNAFDIARRARRARRARHAVRPPATPAANAPAKRRKIV